MKILVTGGSGFIGSHIVEHFQGRAEVRVLDNLRSGHRHNLAGLECDFREGSILDRAAVRSALEGVDYAFHLAAMISVPESMQKPIECVELNALGTLLVLEEAARAGVKKLVFSSSAAIYGDNPVTPKVETMVPEPKSPYAVTKLDGEYYCRMFTAEGRLATAALRYFNVFGPRQDPRSAYAAAVPIFVHQARRHEPIRIFGDGGQTRDFIFVKDIAAANAHFALHDSATGVFNVAYGGQTSVLELARTIIQLTGSRSVIEHAPERAGDVRHSVAAIDRLRQTGFVPQGSLAEGLRLTLA
ncbi:MAG TPA: NAD-dependent epimerase/dehydratase family protein [Verrucomicrobiae bacterium]|jgi:UDP-glucose 4-epimerase|nr:NAD-dependent epimerase/dehydratase family protein [Verrucomicrobiae bacterium]